MDDAICNILLVKTEENGNLYCHFFYPEIKNFAGKEKTKAIENELINKNSSIFDNFDEKREEGENDSFICSLIRNDSVDKFIEYINRTNISLKSEVSPSIFETNSFLIENKNSTLIEYSAFFGSIRIFQYLRLNNIDLEPSLWLYAIHSRNAEMIQLLEDFKVDPPNDNYENCLCESIKYHHNDITDYFENNLIVKSNDETKKSEKILSYTLQSHNYIYFPSDFENGDDFFYLCLYNYHTLINLFMKMKKLEFKKVISDISDDFSYAMRNAACHNRIDIIYYLLLFQKTVSLFCPYKKNLRKLVIPSSVTEIGNNAFNGFSSLTQIIIPSSVALIGNDAFHGCSSLTQITIPSSVTEIGNSAFEGCSSLTQITIPSSVTSIGDSAFKGCSSLTQITIPSSVTKIGNGAFSGCSSLIITGNISKIFDDMFSKCSSLKQITISSSVTKIGNNAFYKCSSLIQITIPSSVKSIGNGAFNGCSSLTQITIPSSVIKIENHAFDGCSSLAHITTLSSLTQFGECTFLKCSSLVQITIPSSLTLIGRGAFCECSSLTQITIPSSVTKIGNNAFKGCSSLTQISIPSKIKTNCLEIPSKAKINKF